MNELINKDTKLELHNGRYIHFSYMSDFNNPIFRLDGDKNKLTIIDNKIYSVCGDDEPSFPVKDEFQAKILVTHNYNFFNGTFEVKGK